MLEIRTMEGAQQKFDPILGLIHLSLIVRHSGSSVTRKNFTRCRETKQSEIS